MSESVSKDVMKKHNKEYLETLYPTLLEKKRKGLEKLINDKKAIVQLNPIRQYIVFTLLLKDILHHKDSEVIECLNSFGLTKHTHKVFKDFSTTFKQLNIFQDYSEFLFPYKTTFGFLELHLINKLKEEVAYDLNIDLFKIAKKNSRKEKNGSLPFMFDDLFFKTNQMSQFIEENYPTIKYYKNKKNMTNASFHTTLYSHKICLYNLYDSLLEFNKKAGYLDHNTVGDFKVFFYDLLFILLPDTSILKKYDDEDLTYGETNNTRFKKKKIESLILR